MKSALELMDDFCDDYYSGFIAPDPNEVATTLSLDIFTKYDKAITQFYKEIEQYRKSSKEERIAKADKLLHDLEYFRRVNLFPYTNESVKSLKIKIDNLTNDNKELAKELQ